MQPKPVVAVLATAVAFATLLSACAEKEDVISAPPLPQVGVVTLKTQSYSLTTEMPGRTTALRVAEVRPQVNGIILKRLFTEGVDVKAGQQLYQIDPSIYQANLESARATLRSANSLAYRYKQLINEQAVSRQEYDTAVSSALQALAAVQTAQINLRYTRMLAPIAGRIGRSAVTEGALVSSAQQNAVATIQQLDPIFVDVVQSSADMLKLRTELDSGELHKAGANAAKVKLILEDGSEYGLDGKLEFSEVAVDQSTGSVTLRAVFPNPDHRLLPGMFVHARLQAGVNATAILAPQQGVTRDLRGMPTALIVNENNKVELRTLEANRTVGSEWLIEKGLEAGDRVITEGLQYIKPGSQVRVVEATNVKPVSASPASEAGKTAGSEGSK
ncbi:Toluene efflux pump periplasmic linker protein TtgA [Pseudomonas fluorescens]|nr:Toluene efflux pump periplasmic linker protein TtgA [Pseudomonas fluorescens]